jgi:hypothetical protein
MLALAVILVVLGCRQLSATITFTPNAAAGSATSNNVTTASKDVSGCTSCLIVACVSSANDATGITMSDFPE